MEFDPYFRNIIEQDNCAVVICDKNHTIIYMNSVAVTNYGKYGGSELIGKSLLSCHNENTQGIIKSVVEWFEKSADNNRVHSGYNAKQEKDLYMIALRDENKELIGYYEKHEFRTRDMSSFYDMK